MLWTVFGTKRQEVTGQCRKLHNEELQNLYVHFTNIITVETPNMKLWAGRVARLETRDVNKKF